jgi:hypothetical protein
MIKCDRCGDSVQLGTSVYKKLELSIIQQKLPVSGKQGSNEIASFDLCSACINVAFNAAQKAICGKEE